MTLLGQFALWVAFLIGSFGAILSFSGRWQDRPDLERVVIRSVYAVAAALLVASISLWKGLFAHDFNIEYVCGLHLPQPPDLLPRVGVLGRAEGLAALLGGRPLDLRRRSRRR